MTTVFGLRPLARHLNKTNADSQAGANGKRKQNYLHIDSGIEEFVQAFFAGGLPYPSQHLKVLDQERKNRLIQDQEQEIPATE
jgi:hypothetical protein